MEAEFHGVPFHIVLILSIRNGVSVLSDNDSACRTAFSTSFVSYSGLAMQKLAHRKRKALRMALTAMCSEKAE